LPFTRLGRFRIVRELGRGTFGVVFLAADPHLQRQVALKVPRAECLLASELRERFVREARAAAGLDHPNVVAVYEAGEVEGVYYIASAYCPGITLAEWLADNEERTPFRMAAQLLLTLSEAVQHAHSRGVIHRDLKPSNVLLQMHPEASSPTPSEPGALATGGGVSGFQLPFIPKVTDFGLAKLALARRDQGEPGASATGDQTRSGAVVGTPHYMAPEQASGKNREVGPAADTYALGAILYELLTGRPPFQGETVLDTLEQVRSREPVPPRRLRRHLPPDLETICLKCLAKEPRRRYRSAGALALDLRCYLAGEPILARRTGWARRLLLWLRRNPSLAVIVCLAVLVLAVVQGAPIGAVFTALTVGSLLFGLYKVKAAADLAQQVEEIRQDQQQTAAAFQFVLKHYVLAQKERDRAVASEDQARRRFGLVRKLAQGLIFDVLDRIEHPPARALLVEMALAYLDDLAKEASEDPVLLRELAVAYAKVADVQGNPRQAHRSDAAGALASIGKSREIFSALARAYPDNPQAQRDLAISQKRFDDLKRALEGPQSGEWWVVR
jgi:serine/threonine protein kinase